MEVDGRDSCSPSALWSQRFWEFKKQDNKYSEILLLKKHHEATDPEHYYARDFVGLIDIFRSDIWYLSSIEIRDWDTNRHYSIVNSDYGSSVGIMKSGILGTSDIKMSEILWISGGPSKCTQVEDMFHLKVPFFA